MTTCPALHLVVALLPAPSTTPSLQPVCFRLDPAMAVLAVARSKLEHLCTPPVSMRVNQNPTSNTQTRTNRLSVSDKSVPIPRLIPWMRLQSRGRVNLADSPSQSVWAPRPVASRGFVPPWYLQVSNGGSRVSRRYSHQPGQPKSLLPLQPPYIEEENLVSGEGPWKPRPAGKSFWYLA